MRLSWTAERRRAAVRIFIEQHARLEWPSAILVMVGVLVVGLSASNKNLAGSFPAATRSGLYISLTATAAALLGFVLAGLAILIALPTGERLTQLQKNNEWERIPGTFLRAAVGLLAMLVLASLALGADLADMPRLYLEVPLAGIAVVTLERVVATVVALEAVLAVINADLRSDPGIIDP
jgi:drug/metabolite transporter (DMT)-like permease